MGKIKIEGTILEIDVREELEPYFQNVQHRWTENRLISVSPFRFEQSPSFFVYLDEGTWGDSGGIDHKTGTFDRLLSFLRDESIEETWMYLKEKYYIQDYQKLKLKIDFKLKEEFIPLEEPVGEYAYEYLIGRGISKEVIENAMICTDGKRIEIPWYDTSNIVIAKKYRAVSSKFFWYAKGGKELNKHLYNLQRIYQKPFTSIWITEAEIDALSVESTVERWVGVGIGGARFSNEQRDAIVRTGIPNVIIATDSDKQGDKVANVIRNKLTGYVQLYHTNLLDCKDINEFIQRYKKLPSITKLKNNPLGF